MKNALNLFIVAGALVLLIVVLCPAETIPPKPKLPAIEKKEKRILGEPIKGDPGTRSLPVKRTEPDPHPPIKFDPEAPYRLEFGRGSYWHGLAMVVLDEQGKAALSRLARKAGDDACCDLWETASLTLSPAAQERIANVILEQKLLSMARSYSADVCDGTQWTFLLRQGSKTKEAEFDNHFPAAIQEFAVSLDRELDYAGLKNAVWTLVLDTDARKHKQTDAH